MTRIRDSWQWDPMHYFLFSGHFLSTHTPLQREMKRRKKSSLPHIISPYHPLTTNQLIPNVSPNPSHHGHHGPSPSSQSPSGRHTQDQTRSLLGEHPPPQAHTPPPLRTNHNAGRRRPTLRPRHGTHTPGTHARFPRLISARHAVSTPSSCILPRGRL